MSLQNKDVKGLGLEGRDDRSFGVKGIGLDCWGFLIRNSNDFKDNKPVYHVGFE